jgi:hypothetical protein
MNRVKVHSNWTAIPNALIRDNTLSPNARVLFGILLSFAAEFVFRTEYVRGLLGVGRDAYRTAFNELEARGLAKRVRSRQSTGSWVWDIELFPPESDHALNFRLWPCPDLPATGEPATGEPATVNQGIKEEQEKEDLLEEDLLEEEGASAPAQSAGEWLAEMLEELGITLSPVQCDAIYMQARAYMDDSFARRYLAIKSAELAAAGVKPRVMVRALAQDASEYARILCERSIGREVYAADLPISGMKNALPNPTNLSSGVAFFGVERAAFELLVEAGFSEELSAGMVESGLKNAVKYLEMEDRGLAQKLTCLVGEHADTINN